MTPEELKGALKRQLAPRRAKWQKPAAVVRALGLRRGQVIAEVGSGPGYFTPRLARAVGPSGHVYALDPEPAVLDVMRKRIKKAGVRNVTPVLSRDDDPLLPNGRCDLAVIINVYHHMHGGAAFLRRLVSRLPRGARVINVDWDENSEFGPPPKRRVPKARFLRDARACRAEARRRARVPAAPVLPRAAPRALRPATNSLPRLRPGRPRPRLRPAVVGAQHAAGAAAPGGGQRCGPRPPAAADASPTVRVPSSGSTSMPPTGPRRPSWCFCTAAPGEAAKPASQAYAAETFVRAGAHWVVPEFATVMEVGLDGMVAQVRRAVAWVVAHAASFGADAARVYVGGHSSGGHLAGNVLVTDWKTEFGLPADVVKGGLCVSGMYDLKAVRLSARSSYVKFDDRIEHELSPHAASRPAHRAGGGGLRGANDSPEFQRQSREFADALRAIGQLRRSSSATA